MSDWTQVDQVAKDDAGNYMALTGGKWVPASGGAKSEDGKYMAYGLDMPSQQPKEQPPTRDLSMQSRIIPRRTDPSVAPGFNAGTFPEMLGGGITDLTGLPALGAAAKAVSGMAPFNPMSVARFASRAIPEIAGNIKGGIGGVIDVVKGVPAKTASEALRGEVSGELGNVQRQYTDAAAQSQRELDAINRQAAKSTEGKALTDIASAQGAVKDKLKTQADAFSNQANQHLDTLAPKSMSAEDIGAFIQDRGASNLASAKANTVKTAITDIKDPAFARARERAASGDTPSTNPNSKPIIDAAIQDIEQQIADTPAEFAQGLKKRINSLLGGERQMTAAEQRVENLRASIQGREPVSTVKEPITLQQLEFLRRWAKDPILRQDTGFGALDATRMAKTSDTISAAMKAYEPAVADYINAYKAGKQAETALLGGSRGTRATDKILETDAATIFGQKPQLAASAYLDGTKSSAMRLLQLVGGKKDEIAPIINSYLRGQIEGKTPQEVMKILQKNSGLFDVFPESKTAITNYAKATAEAERLSALASKETGRIADTSNAALKARDAARNAQGKAIDSAATNVEKSTAKAADYANEITILDSMPSDKVVSQARSTANKMLKDGFIDENRYKELSNRIAEIEKLHGKTKTARNAIRYTLYTAGGAAAYGAGKHYLPLP